jgi:type I restriction enzyme S subunit
MAFETKPLREIARLASGGTPSKANPKYWGGAIPWLTPKDMSSYDGTTQDRVTSDAIGNGTRRAPMGSLFIAVRGMSLHNEIRIVRPDHQMTFNQDIKAITPAEAVDGQFLYYAMLAKIPELLGSVEAAGHGTGVLPTDKLNDLAIPIIPLPEQLAIAATLGALDDKIELNRHMNETLEAMARVLFRDWFFDFGPTRAKMEGLEPYLDPYLWALFPDRLDDEGKPEGWELSNLASILTVLETGRRPKGGVAGISGGVPSVGAESIDGVGKFDFGKTKFVSEEFFSKMAKGHISVGDVLIYKDGGKPGELRPSVSYVSNGFPFDKFCINEHVFRARSDQFDQAFLYCLLSTDDAFAQMRELATGVAQPGLNQMQMGRLSFVLPKNKELLDHTASTLKTLIDTCNVNASESQTLAQTRDLLLPRLMSGDLRVADADKVIEGVY